MINRCSATLTLIAALVLVAGLHCTADADQVSLLALVCAEGGLEAPGSQYANRLLEAAKSSGCSLALQLDNGTDCGPRRLVKNGIELPAAPGGGGAIGQTKTVAEFLGWGARVTGASTAVVVVYGHGTDASGLGPAGQRVGPWPSLATGSGADPDALEPAELAGAIHRGLGGKADLVVLDSCYGASIEVAWALRNAAKVVVASPGRVPVEGLDWERLTERRTAGGAEELARSWSAAAGHRVVAIRTTYLEKLFDRIRAVCMEALPGMDGLAPVLTGALSSVPRWGSENQLCDLRGLMRTIAGTEGAVADEAGEALAVLDACTLTDQDRVDGGLTMPFRSGLGDRSRRFDPDGFVESSGWGRLTRAYAERLKDLIHRTGADQGCGVPAA